MLKILAFLILTFAGNVTLCTKPYCESCLESVDSCDSCVENYILVNGGCKFKRELGCEKLTLINGIYECTDGYKFNFETKECEEGNEICSKIDEKFNCNSCAPGYLFGKTKCLDCFSINPYCVSIGEDDCNVCAICAPGTKLNTTTGICELFDEFCSFSPNGICEKCFNGYYLPQDGKCEKGNISQCIEYKTNETCTKCFKTFLLENGVCIEDPNCRIINEFNDTCAQCNDGYSIVENRCKACEAQNCQSCSTDLTKCDSCTVEFPVFADPDCVTCTALNCSTRIYGDPTTCFTCNRGFVAVDGVCKPCGDTNCGDCSSGVAKCDYCKRRYGFDVENNMECASCVVDNYVYCTSNKDGCHSCEPGFTVQDNKCYQTISNCGTYNVNGSCNTCYIGYNLENGVCNKELCRNSYGEDRECDGGINGYYQTNSYKCVGCEEKCSYGCVNSAIECLSLNEMRFENESCLFYD